MMLTAIAVAVALSRFDVRSIPTPDPDGRVLLGHVDSDSTQDVIVVHGRDLAFHRGGGGEALTARLPEKARVFDLDDIDGDGWAELISLTDEAVVRTSIASGDSTPLFHASTEYVESPRGPYPRALTARRQDQPVFVLPRGDVVELRTTSGQLIDTVRPRRTADDDPLPRRKLSSYAWSTEPAGDGGQLWMHLTREASLEFSLPEDLKRPRSALHGSRFVEASQAYHWNRPESLSWPSMVIRSKPPRVTLHYTLSEPNTQETLVEIRTGSANDGASTPVPTGSPHAFPGVLVVFPTQSPDFNGDGYGDLLLWRTPEPGTSMQSITRTLTGGTWPIRFTVHLYEPDKERFNPRPSAGFACRVPVGWLLDIYVGWPVRNAVARDFNGDGRADIGMSLTGEDYAIWLMGDNGFRDKPDFEHDFGETVRLLFEEEWDSDHRWAVGLKSAGKVHVIRYTAP